MRGANHKLGLGVLALAAASAAVSYRLYRRDLAAARARLAEASELVTTPCGPIEYAAVGTGPPILVVHGAGGGFDQGLAFGRILASRGFRVVAMSRFGYRRTPLPADASAAAQAGAPSSLQFALRHPDRASALVLVVPAAYVPRAGDAPSLKTPAWTQLVFDTALRSDFLFWAAMRLARPTLTKAILATPLEVVEKAAPEERERVRVMLEQILPR